MTRAARLACALAVVLAGCAAEQAGWRLQRLAREAPQRFFPIDRWNYAKGFDPAAPARTPGAAVLRDAAVADRGIADVVRVRGVPDGIAVGGTALTVELAYADERTIVVLEPGAEEAVLPRAWVPSTIVGERPMTDAEVALLATEPRLQHAVDEAGRTFAAGVRFYAVFARLMRALPVAPSSAPAGWGYGYTVTAATPVAARLFGHAESGTGEIVVWVDPAGAAASVLRPGDRVLERGVAGVGEPQNVRLVDETGERTVMIAPERYARAITPWYLATREILAGAMAANVVVGSLLLETLAVDDEVAWVVAHEIAHVALGHVDPGITLGSVVQGALRLGVVLPANLVVPGVGTLVDETVAGIRKRFDRNAERAADAAGIAYARAAGFRPEAAVTALERLTTTFPVSKLGELLDSHPPGPERLEALRALVAGAASVEGPVGRFGAAVDLDHFAGHPAAGG